MTLSSRKPIVWNEETLEGAINGSIVVLQGEQEMPYKLTPKEKQAFETGKKQGYVVANTSRYNLPNAFYRWCDLHQEPYIYAQKRGKYMTAKMDLIAFEDKGYHEDSFFREKMLTVVTAVGVWNTDYSAGGTYSYVTVLPEHVDYICRSFRAIYLQHKGQSIKAPAFPDGTEHSKLFAQFLSAKAQKYALVVPGQRWLSWRWEEFCKAYHWPCIKVLETKKGSAKVTVDLPEAITFPPSMTPEITRLAQQTGFKVNEGMTRVIDGNFAWNDSFMLMFRSLPTSACTQFAEGMQKLLENAGYFPTIDESWHG
jgi:hypothetical protein